MRTDREIALWLLCGFVLLATGKEANAAPDRWLNAKIEEAVRVVRLDSPGVETEEALMQLAKLTHRAAPSAISEKTIADMISLLDVPDEQVHFWVAGALGNLGRRAKVAIPKLLAILPEADCKRGDMTAADAIRPALERMGVKPPAPDYASCQSTKN